MGAKGSDRKIQSIRFPLWMADAIQKLADKGGHTFTDVVLELLRKELAFEGYSMGIGRESADEMPETIPYPDTEKIKIG